MLFVGFGDHFLVDDLADSGSVRQHKKPDTVAIHILAPIETQYPVPCITQLGQTAGVDQRIIRSEDGNGNPNEA